MINNKLPVDARTESSTPKKIDLIKLLHEFELEPEIAKLPKDQQEKAKIAKLENLIKPYNITFGDLLEVTKLDEASQEKARKPSSKYGGYSYTIKKGSDEITFELPYTIIKRQEQIEMIHPKSLGSGAWGTTKRGVFLDSLKADQLLIVDPDKVFRAEGAESIAKKSSRRFLGISGEITQKDFDALGKAQQWELKAVAIKEQLMGELAIGNPNAERKDQLKRLITMTVKGYKEFETPGDVQHQEDKKEFDKLAGQIFKTTATGMLKVELFMPLAKGKGMDGLVADPKLPLDDRIAIFTGLVEAVNTLHTEGIIHGDLKPANSIAEKQENGSYKVSPIDYGGARFNVEGQIFNLDRSGASYLYGAPEVLMPGGAGKSATFDNLKQVDKYALGTTLLEILGMPTLPFQVIQLTVPGFLLNFALKGIEKSFKSHVEDLCKKQGLSPEATNNLKEQLYAIFQSLTKKYPAQRANLSDTVAKLDELRQITKPNPVTENVVAQNVSQAVEVSLPVKNADQVQVSLPTVAEAIQSAKAAIVATPIPQATPTATPVVKERPKSEPPPAAKSPSENKDRWPAGFFGRTAPSNKAKEEKQSKLEESQPKPEKSPFDSFRM